MVESYTYHLLLGGNLEETLKCFEQALVRLDEIGETINSSSVFKSKAWGYESENEYKNQAILYTCALAPFELLEKTQAIEKELGRSKKQLMNYEDRNIDIDILFCDNLIVDTESLTIPHKMLHLRAFTLEPLCEISPEIIHPIFNKTISQLLKDLKRQKESIDN